MSNVTDRRDNVKPGRFCVLRSYFGSGCDILVYLMRWTPAASRALVSRWAGCLLLSLRDHTNIYFDDDPGRRPAAKLLTKEEARIATNIAKLPGLLGKAR